MILTKILKNLNYQLKENELNQLDNEIEMFTKIQKN